MDATTSWKVFLWRRSRDPQTRPLCFQGNGVLYPPVSTLAAARRHVLPGHHEGAHRLRPCPGEGSLYVLGGSPQRRRTAVLPVVDGAPPLAVVQVAQQGGDHPHRRRHLPQVLALRRRLLEGHEAVGVDLEPRVSNSHPEEFVMATAAAARQEVLSGLCFGECVGDV